MTARRFAGLAAAAAALIGAGALAGLPRRLAAVARSALAEALGPRARVRLRFSHGLPLLCGRLEHVRLSAADILVSGLRVRRLKLSAELVRLDLPALIGARRLAVSGVHGLVAQLIVGERALNELLSAHGVHVRLDAGSAHLSASEVRAQGGFSLDGGRAWFRPDRLWVGGVPLPPLLWQRWLRRLDLGRATVDVTGLPLPVRLTGVEVRAGELVLSAVGPDGL